MGSRYRRLKSEDILVGRSKVELKKGWTKVVLRRESERNNYP